MDTLAHYEFANEPVSDLFCGICKEVACDASVTVECGHLFCLACAERSMKESDVCPMCRFEGFQIRTDHRARRQIADLKVLCKFRGCEWSGPMSDIASHQLSCRLRPVLCEFHFAGCTDLLQPGEVHAHELEEAAKHVRLLAMELQKERQLKKDEGSRDVVSQREVACLKEALHAMRQTLDEQGEELLALRGRLQREGDQHRTDLCELRRHTSIPRTPSTGFRPLEGLRWDTSTEKFAFSENGKTATHDTPGWSTLCCVTGVSTGKWMWDVELGVADWAEYTSSTIMVGVTCNKYSVPTHLGNIRGSWCYQDNGFRWDGTQCYAYGDSCAANDVLTVVCSLRGFCE